MIIKLNKGTTTPVLLTITSIVRDIPPTNPKYTAQHKLVGHTPEPPSARAALLDGGTARDGLRA